MVSTAEPSAANYSSSLLDFPLKKGNICRKNSGTVQKARKDN
jgi:hypothetical protein